MTAEIVSVARAYDRAMRARVWIVGLVITSGCAATLPESEWVTERPRGECVVTIERGDATGTWTLEHHYAADGRVLSGTARLRYHGRAWERFEHDDAGRLVAIYSYEEIDAESFPCAAEGGCDTPARRVLSRVHVEHDPAGRLSRWAFEERTFGRRPDGTYAARTSEGRDVSYRYDDAGRLVASEGGNGSTRYVYEADRLVRVERDADYPWFDTVEHDAEGRIVGFDHHACTPERECHVTYQHRYAYDDQGRLVRADLTDADGSSPPTYTLFDYEGERVVRRTRVERLATGEQRRVREHTYDARGRLIATVEDGQPRERRSYAGTCDAVTTGPAAPSPLLDLGARPCVRSPAYVLDECSGP